MSDAHSAAVIPLRATAVDAYADLVAFLFTDIEGSSLKWLNYRVAMQDALRVHDEILRKAVARVRGSPVSNRTMLGQVLANLGGVLVEQGELDEALGAMSEAMPMVREGGWFFRFGDHFALRLAKAGHAEAAARLLGYTDVEHARFKATRQVNEARAHASVQRLLDEALAPAELAQRMAEGPKLTEDEAARLALEP